MWDAWIGLWNHLLNKADWACWKNADFFIDIVARVQDLYKQIGWTGLCHVLFMFNIMQKVRIIGLKNILNPLAFFDHFVWSKFDAVSNLTSLNNMLFSEGCQFLCTNIAHNVGAYWFLIWFYVAVTYWNITGRVKMLISWRVIFEHAFTHFDIVYHVGQILLLLGGDTINYYKQVQIVEAIINRIKSL